jgi:hypothetical protein
MRKISGLLTHITAASPGFSEGQLKDNPGDGTGSGITASVHTDMMYGFVAPIIKYNGALSDAAESETASDMLTAIDRAAGVQNENVAEWDVATVYAADDHVMYLGLQFVSVAAANVGNDPIDSPAEWIPCLNRDEVLRLHRDGVVLLGGLEAIHDHRDAGYRQYFSMGKYNFGGAAGRNFQATAFHLDGTVLTGDAVAVALLDVGGAAEYHLLDLIAPDVMGTRTFIDARGHVLRPVDGAAGVTEDIGVLQDDAMQQITGQFTARGEDVAGNPVLGNAPTGVFTNSGGSGTNMNAWTRSATSKEATKFDFDSSTSISPAAAKTDPAETRMKNLTVGVPYVVVLTEIP